jgi:hypothetical protein
MGIVGVLIVLVIAVVLSGLLEIDPGRDYGALSTIGRALQSILGRMPGGGVGF